MAAVRPLPYIPDPELGELLSSWLRRIAAEYAVTLTAFAAHVGLKEGTAAHIDHKLTKLEVRALAFVTRREPMDIVPMTHVRLSDAARPFVTRQQPFQTCRSCLQRFQQRGLWSVVLKAWHQLWKIECSRCQRPFTTADQGTITVLLAERQDLEWIDHILPLARQGAAHVSSFIQGLRAGWWSPLDVLALLSLPAAREVSYSRRSGASDDLGGRTFRARVVGLLLPGYNRRARKLGHHLRSWTAIRPARTIHERITFLAGLARFYEDPRRRLRYIRGRLTGVHRRNFDRALASWPPDVLKSLGVRTLLLD